MEVVLESKEVRRAQELLIKLKAVNPAISTQEAEQVAVKDYWKQVPHFDIEIEQFWELVVELIGNYF